MKEIDGWRDENLHSRWSGELKPIATISSHETLRIRIPDSSTKQIREDFTDEGLKTLDNSKFDWAVGPIYVEGASVGDLLEVKIENLETANWGWSAILKDFGLLKGEFDEKIVIWKVANDYITSARKGFLENIRIPSKPFLGVIGTAPKSGEFPMIPPQYFGGNMDNKLIGVGAKLYLPVNREGGLISFADPHASQGDGEVCGTAIETSVIFTASISVIKNKSLSFPRIFSKEDSHDDLVVTQGFADDLHKAAKYAVSGMIEYLSEIGYSRDEGYVLCSVAGNLRISEIVDEPNFGVSMVLPSKLLIGSH